MKHPLYNDPEYVAAIAETKECDELIQSLRNRSFRAWKLIEQKEKEYNEGIYLAKKFLTKPQD